MSVANAYAKALYEAATDAKSTSQDIDRIESELQAVSGLLRSSREISAALTSPITTTSEKVGVLEALSKRLGTSVLVSQFFLLLARKGRFQVLPKISEAFRVVRLVAEGGIAATLVSADPMNKEDIEALSKTFSAKYGKRVAFQVSTDPSLLAGMKVTVNGVTYDGTLHSQLQQLRDRVTLGFTGNQ